MANIVVHGLSIFKENEEGLCRIRSTIRTGKVELGQELIFTNPKGTQHSLKVKKLREGPGRHITLTLEGDTEAINDFKGGYYLFGS